MFNWRALGAVLSVTDAARLAMPSMSRRLASKAMSSCFRLLPITGVVTIVGASAVTWTTSWTFASDMTIETSATPPSGTSTCFSIVAIPLIVNVTV